MDTREALRWQFTLEGGATAKLLWIIGAAALLLGLGAVFYAYSHDRFLWPCGVASTAVSWFACWLLWLAFPLYEQVGIDRDELHI
jgi:hypothetical protein